MNKIYTIDKKSALGILISIICLYFFIIKINFSEVFYHLETIKLSYVFFAIVVIYISVWFRAFRWKYLFKEEYKIKIIDLYENQMMGYLFNNIFPIRAGEFIRALFLAKKYNQKTSFIFGTIILERLLDTFHIFFFAVVLLLTGYFNETIISKINSLLLIAFHQILNNIFIILIISFLIIVLSIMLFKFLLSKNFIDQQLKPLLNNLLNGLLSIEKKYLIQIMFFGSLIWLSYWLDVYLIQYAFNLKMSVSQSLLVLILCSLILAIPAAPGMIGTFHLAVQYIMVDLLGYGVNESAAFAIILHFYGYLTYNAFGLFHLINGGYYKMLFSNKEEL